MKKILPALVLFSVLAILFLPVVVSAQARATECCRLGTRVELFDAATNANVTYPAGTLVGQNGGWCGVTNAIFTGTDQMDRLWGTACILNTIYNVVNWIFLVLVVLSVVVAIIGAFMIVTSAGDPTRVTSGRNYIIYAIVGLLLAFVARAIPGIARMVMGA